MRSIFVLFGQMVNSLGIVASILLVGLLPMYIAAYFYRFKKIGFKASGVSVPLYSLAIISSLLMLAILMICAVVVGQWG